jgi:pimeloyl-ACP methyl ester carboxylesterase
MNDEAPEATYGTSGALHVKDLGSFHIGGRQITLSGSSSKELRFSATAPAIHTDPNGEFETGQMYVQYVRLAAPRAKYPLLLWHGGGLTGVTYETKPDGGEGWQMAFLRAGYDVYVSDAVERGRASWSRYPEVYDSEPVFRNKAEGWELFRIGPEWHVDATRRVPFEGTQFPVSEYDQFTKQFVPRWTTNNAITQTAYDALLQRVGPCVIVVHSQGSHFAFEAARRAPDKVKALVAIEPTAGPDATALDISGLKSVPHLFVWGDFLDRCAVAKSFMQPVHRYVESLRKQGTAVDVVDLPELGIHGNSHMMMMDLNSGQIAALIQQWLAKQGVEN